MDLGVSLIKEIVTLFDYALYPFYMVIHRPWLVIKRRQKQRAWLSYLAKNRVLYKGVQVMMNFFKSSEDCESGGVVPNAQAPKAQVPNIWLVATLPVFKYKSSA